MQLEIWNQLDQLKRINIPEGVKILIVEGFDSVGKTTMMDRLVERSQYLVKKEESIGAGRFTPALNLWKPNYSNMKKSFLPYSGRYILNLALFDLIEQSVVNLSETDIMIVDRGLISAVVYSELKDQDNKEYVLSSDFIDHMRKLYRSDMVHHIYLQPQSKDYHKIIYENSHVDDTRESEEYDMEGDFDKYYEEYLKADELYIRYLDDVCGVDGYTIIDPEDYSKVGK